MMKSQGGSLLRVRLEQRRHNCGTRTLRLGAPSVLPGPSGTHACLGLPFWPLLSGPGSPLSLPLHLACGHVSFFKKIYYLY